jgi:hypothetical protein
MFSCAIDPNDATFWVDFKRKLLMLNADQLDCRGIMHLKLIFNGIATQPDRLTALVPFLTFVKVLLPRRISRPKSPSSTRTSFSLIMANTNQRASGS